ncbi:MAG: GGDEF domain-containing protein [Spirochaetales bacterium]|nr:GGDEF domain-containing protein [Spirochaetales bacterium]
MLEEEYLIKEDQEAPEELVSLSGERSYTIEQLLRTIPQIDVIRECNVIHYDGFIELKEVKRYSLDFDKRKGDNFFTPADFSRLFGSGASEVYRLLEEQGYAESRKGRIRLKTKTLVATFDDFHLGRSREFERVVFNGLEHLLKREIELNKDDEGLWTSREAYLLYDKRAQPVPRINRSSRDYIFRIGNRFLYVDFFYIPSQELLELIQLRLTLIYQEQMENFFQIISSFSLDRDLWQKGIDRRRTFKDVLESLFRDAWSLFDLDYFSVQIHSRESEYSFARGAFNCRLDEEGHPSWDCHREVEELPAVFDLSREFLARNVQLVYSQFSGEAVSMDIYLKSRSVNNIDPRTSVLLHSFIKLLKEALSRVIETVIPILQMEEANRTLRRHLFLESLRVKNRSYGENISLIINQSLSVIKWAFSLPRICLYAPGNSDFTKMLRIFQEQDREGEEKFTLLKAPMTTDMKGEGNFIEVKVLEQIGENISFYFKIPLERDEEEYLAGTAVERIVRSLLHQYGLTWPERGLKEVAEWKISPNAGMVTNDLRERLSAHRDWLGKVDPASVASRIIKSFSLFFDLVSSLNLNLESGITAMRGSRDRLTGLYNRQAFTRRLDQLFDQNSPFGLLFIDMDTFKIYNDAVSHAFGDKLLIQLASCMLAENRRMEGDSLPGRFGGDEFCFAICEKDPQLFQEHIRHLFSAITGEILEVRFYLDDRPAGPGFDINLISFLHRLLRPDVGGVRGSGSDYAEERGMTPRERLSKLYLYYQREVEGNEPDGEPVEDEKLAAYFVQTVCDKMVRNRIFDRIDEEFTLIIRMFLDLQLQNLTTDRIRAKIMTQLGRQDIIRTIRLRISAGAAHTCEDRLRSVSSLFNAADGRAYMAKHNGRNGMFGLNNQRLI